MELGKRYGVVIPSISIIFVLLLGTVPLSAYAGSNNAQAPEFALKCYQNVSTVDPGLTPFQDQFQNTNVNPDVDQRYCVEALKHSSLPPPNPRYWIEHEDEPNGNLLNPNGVVITDQFLGTFTANLFHFETLVPASGTAANNSPDNLVQGLANNQPYSGYSPSTTTNLPTSTVQVTDQFGTSMITLDSIFAFEASAIVGPQGSLTGQDLTCYMFLEDDEVPPINPTPAQSASTWVTQFAPLGIPVVDLGQADVLCVMADKTPPTPPVSAIGGDIVPLDTTMVLVAGSQSTAAWMIPVIVSGIGIAIVIARKF